MIHIRRTMLTVVLGTLATVASLPSDADAQSRGRGRGRADSQGIPPGHLPPPGECRVWYDDVPPGHQPEPTSCARARRIAARTGGRVIYGNDARGRLDDRSDDRRDGRRDRDDDDRDFDRDDFPVSLPLMRWGVDFRRGEDMSDVRRWLGTTNARNRVTDANRNGSPENVIWYDSAGRIVQQWVDTDGDGRANRVSIFRDGKLVRTIDSQSP